jgi:hypothetical protein
MLSRMDAYSTNNKSRLTRNNARIYSIQKHVGKFAGGRFTDFCLSCSHILARFNILIFNLRWYEVHYVKYQQERVNEKLLAFRLFYRLS